MIILQQIIESFFIRNVSLTVKGGLTPPYGFDKFNLKNYIIMKIYL